PAESLEIQVFENLGLGMRSALEPRDLANAIQTIAERFATQESAAEHFGRTPTWLGQATAAAKLSPKISALLDSGRIGSAGAAVQLEKLTQKNEAKAESLIERIAQQPEGEKLARKTVDHALQEEGGRRRKKAENAAVAPAAPAVETSGIPPWEDIPTAPARRQFNPGKVKMVARLLGVADGDEEEVLARLIDEFLALKGEGETPF
ncbi:MAG: chromosome partitioning protein ParB, partial [Rhodocyclaceae bacterium]